RPGVVIDLQLLRRRLPAGIVFAELIACLADDSDAAVAVRVVAVVADERADASGLAAQQVERIKAGKPGVEPGAGALVEELERAPGIVGPTAVDRALEAADTAQLRQQEARDLICGRLAVVRLAGRVEHRKLAGRLLGFGFCRLGGLGSVNRLLQFGDAGLLGKTRGLRRLR